MLPLWSDPERGVRVVQYIEPDEVEALVSLFEAVAVEEGWHPEGALRFWSDHSVYFALEAEGRLAGGLQLVRGDQQKALPCQTLWPEVPVDPSFRTAHVAVLAMDRISRGRDANFWALVVEMWRYCVREGISSILLEVTPRVLPIYRRLGWPLEVRGELRHHWGEDCYLCALDIPAVAQALLRRAERSPYYRRIVAQAFRMTLPSFGRQETGVPVVTSPPSAAL